MLRRTFLGVLAALALVATFAAPAQALSVGDKAPDFSGKWFNRADTSLAELRGRVVFVEFWRTW